MQKIATLNCLYADYSAGRLEKKMFEGMIFRTIYKKIPPMPGCTKEDREDFTSWLYPRISRAIDNYKAKGSSFEAYIGVLVSMAAKEYRMQRARGYNSEIAAWAAQVPEVFVHEQRYRYPEHVETAPAQTQNRKHIRNSRQILMLVLKCCRYVSADFLDKISHRLGVEPDTIAEMIERLKEKREKREAYVENLRSVANRQLWRCFFYERSLHETAKDSETNLRVKKRLDHFRKKLAKSRERLAAMSLDPSNAQIAELLGITKGTVDAALHNLKVRWKNIPGEQCRHILN